MEKQNDRTLKVRFTKQQLVFLEMVRAEGRFGESLEQVMREMFREYVRSTLPKPRT
jgi:hypothetical protein